MLFQMMLLFVMLIICPSIYASKRHNGDNHHSHSHIKTLSWAVIISPEETHDIVDTVLHYLKLSTTDTTDADVVASELGLINRGQIAQFTDHFLFEHDFHSKTVSSLNELSAGHADYSVPTFDKLISHLNNSHSISQESWDHTLTLIEDRMELHPRVARFFRQFIRARKKRRNHGSSSSTIHFDDPAYIKQWHLVSKRSIHSNPKLFSK